MLSIQWREIIITHLHKLFDRTLNVAYRVQRVSEQALLEVQTLVSQSLYSTKSIRVNKVSLSFHISLRL